MKRFLITSAVSISLIAGFGAPSFASGIPVVDVASITQLIAQVTTLQNQYETQVEQLTQLQSQYELLTKQFEALSGQSSFDVLGGVADFEVDLTAQDLLGMVSGVQTGSLDGKLGDVAAEVLINAGIEALSENAASGFGRTRSAAQVAGVATGSIALGQAGFDQALKTEERAETLSENVGKQDTLKQAMDYNSLVLAEIARNQSKVISLLSAQLVNAGTLNLDSVRAESANPKILSTVDE